MTCAPRRGRMPHVTADALQDRQQLVSASRVVVKIGSSSLTTPDGRLAPERLNALVEVLAARRAAGGQVVLVSSGAIAAGLGPLGLAARPKDLATQQAAASVGQGLLVAHYTAAFARHGLQVGQVLLTADDTVRRVHYRNAHRALTRLLDLGDRARSSTRTTPWPPTRSGSATTTASRPWSRTWCTPTRCCCSATWTRSTPGRRRATGHAGSRPWSHAQDLEGIDVASRGSAVGTGGMVTKLESVAIATQSGVPVVLTSAAQAAQALAGEDVGTWFTATGRRTSIRRLWLAHAASTRGRLVLDAGRRARRDRARDVAAARRRDRASRGRSRPATPSSWSGPDGALVARGLVVLRRRRGAGAAGPVDVRAARVARPGLRPRAGPPRRPGPGPPRR